jgi:hypothetical protein
MNRSGFIGGSSGWFRSDEPSGMAYIVQRKDHFYVVAYDGTDSAAGRERRRCHPADRCRSDAETIAAKLDEIATAEPTITSTQLTLART